MGGIPGKHVARYEEEWTFVIHFAAPVAARADIPWKLLVPADDSHEWLVVDVTQSTLHVILIRPSDVVG